MLEKQLERKCKAIAERHGCLLPKWVSPGHVGVPDRILIVPGGRVAFIELKQPGKKLSPLQDVWRERLTGRGQVHATIDNTDSFEILIEMLRGSPQLPDGGDQPPL